MTKSKFRIGDRIMGYSEPELVGVITKVDWVEYSQSFNYLVHLDKPMVMKHLLNEDDGWRTEQPWLIVGEEKAAKV